MADDVIALSQVIKDLPRCSPPSAGTMPIDTFDFSEKELDSWKEKFDMQGWAEKRYEEEVLKFGVDEAKEDWIEDIKDNYWKWTVEMREACDSHEMSLNTPKGVLTKILTNDSLELYSDANKDFFFKTPFHENGKLKKADKKDALNYIRDFQDYTIHANNKSKLIEEINHSLNLLKSTL